MIIPQYVTKIISRIEACGHEAYVVGGCVRDLLLDKTPHDWDMTTSATPDEIIDIFYDFKTVPTGIPHGTVTIITQYGPVEITTYRLDGSYVDNRHPTSVTFSSILADDLMRRDFTVNAMAYNPKMGLVDLYGGTDDLRQGTIRTVGDPEIRFREDALRIMRAIRFSATLGFGIHPCTEKALTACSELLENIASERIATELNKILSAKNSASILAKYIPILEHRLFQNQVLKAYTFEDIDSAFQPLNNATPDIKLRLAVLIASYAKLTQCSLLDCGKAFLNNLKYDNHTKNTVMQCLENICLPLKADRIYLRKCIHSLGAEVLFHLLQIKFSTEPHNPQYPKILATAEDIIAKKDCISTKALAVNGSDLISRGFTGRNVGNGLNFLLNAVMEDKCKNQRSELLEYLNTYKELTD